MIFTFFISYCNELFGNVLLSVHNMFKITCSVMFLIASSVAYSVMCLVTCSVTCFMMCW